MNEMQFDTNCSEKVNSITVDYFQKSEFLFGCPVLRVIGSAFNLLINCFMGVFQI